MTLNDVLSIAFSVDFYNKKLTPCIKSKIIGKRLNSKKDAVAY